MSSKFSSQCQPQCQRHESISLSARHRVFHLPIAGRKFVVRILTLIMVIALGGFGWQSKANGQVTPSAQVRVDSAVNDLAPILVSDEDLQLLLDEQDRLAERGAWDLSIPLLQRMLDEGRDIVLRPVNRQPTRVGSNDLERIQTIAHAVEQRMARLPAAGLAQYRLRADGPARALLAEAEQKFKDSSNPASDEASAGTHAADYWRVLEEVDRRYFFSSHGDDAAWLLALDALDRLDFVSASWRLERLARWHPDLTPPKTDIWLRKALADAYLGDDSAARAALASSPTTAAASDAVNASRETIRRHVEQFLAIPVQERSSGGRPDRVQLGLGDGLAEAWDFKLGRSEWRIARTVLLQSDSSEQVSTPSVIATQVARLSATDAFGPGYDELTPRRDSQSLGRRWLDSGWSPPHWVSHSATQLFAGGAKSWSVQPFPLAQESTSVFTLGVGKQDTTSTTKLAADFTGLPAAWSMITPRDVALREPSRRLTAHDAWFWADSLRHVITWQDRRVFCVEPSPSYDAKPLPFAARRWSWRQRANRLAAYDPASGEVAWEIAPTDVLGPSATASESSLLDATFLGPLVVGRRYGFIPTLMGATLYVAAIRLESGEVAWTSRIAGEPRIGAWPWSSLELACDGDEVYAAAGVGVIVALNQETGATRWAATYPRHFARRASALAAGTGTKDLAPTTGIAPSLIPDGWDEDKLAVHGRWLIVTASDSDRLIVLDRRTGATQWTSPRRLAESSSSSELATKATEATHQIGIARGKVVVAGPHSLRAYALASGKLLWRQSLGRLAGRALLDDELVVVPVLSMAQSQRRRLLDAPDGLGGEAIEIDLAAIDMQTGSVRDRRRVLTPGPVPLEVHCVNKRWALSTFDRWLELTPAVSANPPAAEPLSSGSGRLPTSLIRRPTHADSTAQDKPSTASNQGTAKEASGAVAPRCLVTDLAQGQVLELDFGGNILWKDTSIRLPGACAAWRDGRRWVVDHGQNVLVEFNERGQRVAELTGLPARPASITAMSDGSAWIAFPDIGMVGQVDPQGKWRRVERTVGRPVDVVPYPTPSLTQTEKPSESICVALWEGRQAIVLGPQDSPSRTIDFETSPRSLCVSKDGAVYATFATPGQVMRLEFTPEKREGTTSLARGGWQGLRRSFRLASGQWLVAEAASVSFYDAMGKLVWKREGDLNGGLAVVE
ncbi:MAG: PQQ-binding-like beta-propeller repeat protein [Pirellulales bacterium]